MKQRLTLTDLASVLADITGESKKASSDFLREFFALTASTLEGGDSVRIKGFGTFKLTEVDSRKSVNVATGAEMEIPGHRKVSFVPARELAEAVNEAFEMFEPVELSESVTDEMLEIAEEEAEPIDAEAETEVEPAAEAEPSPERVLEKAFEEVKTESAEELNKAFDEAVEREEIREVNEAIEKAEDRILEEDGIADPPVADEEAESYYEERRPRRRFGWGFLVGFLTAAVAAVMVLVFFFDWRPWLTQGNSPENIAVSASPVVVADTLAIPVSTSQDTATAKAVDSVSVSGSEIVPTQPSDPVRYDTVTKTRYLTTMSREYYGNYQFWPYIYEENKAILGHPDRIRPGTKVVVPKLSKYGVDPKNPEDVAEAKRKGVEIYSRYK